MNYYKRTAKAKAENCLGGGCVGENPDRATRPERSYSYKRAHKKHRTPAF